MKKKSKRYRKLIESVKDKKINTINTIISTLKNNANAKFLESIDLSFKINLKKIKTADSSLRSVIELPHGNGKKIRIGVLCDENKLSDAKKSGAEVIGSEDLLKKISSGKIEFDKLGPKGLMPNPKLGTVSDDVIGTVNKIKNKLVEIKNDKDGNLGVSIGRKNFIESKLLENLKSLFQNLKKEKPNIFNSENIKNIYLSSTMGVSFKLKFKDI